jgi:hypothetical protein
MDRNRTDQATECPDLATQLEALLDAVWEAEANWRFDDRLDLALGVHGPAAGVLHSQ